MAGQGAPRDPARDPTTSATARSAAAASCRARATETRRREHGHFDVAGQRLGEPLDTISRAPAQFLAVLWRADRHRLVWIRVQERQSAGGQAGQRSAECDGRGVAFVERDAD